MKNVKITHENSKIYFQFTDVDFFKIGYIDYTDDLWQIVNNLKWRTDGKYIYTGNNTLHKIVMQHWYGKDCYKKMIDSGFVVDHIDNDGFNCLYENLEFLKRLKNLKYKGGYYDIERKNKLPIAAVNIFKKRGNDKFQITIGFNIHFFDSQGLPISKAFFVYDTPDYNLVLSDAVTLVESIGNGRINIQLLRFNRKKVEHPYFITSEKNDLKPGNVLKVDGEWVIIQGEGFQVVKIAPDDTLW